ncbi:hypothetical protein HNR73_005215 [Phytomonospora endophytica]|uniref:Uncharacterized protein n=1 Tax=Phytomonospora endophytica TaxID=714109 RepID=A0A841FY09_9ACTN|nr:hypothetical protein [Phytomonospora endophytica]
MEAIVPGVGGALDGCRVVWPIARADITGELVAALGQARR